MFFLPGGIDLALAGDSQGVSRELSVAKALAANRSLITQYTTDYIRLKKEADKADSGELRSQLEKLKYKINALGEDRANLFSMLSERRLAHELMKDVLTKESGIQRILVEELQPDQPQAPSFAASPNFSLELLHERALQFAASHQYEEAEKIYEEIILKDPDDDQAYVIMGHISLLMGDYAKAEEAFRNAVSIDPENIQEITPFYENIVVQNPNDTQAFTNLGYAYLILGEFLKAREAFKNALDINPDNQIAQNGMATLEN